MLPTPPALSRILSPRVTTIGPWAMCIAVSCFIERRQSCSPGNLQGRHIRETGLEGKGCTIVEVDQGGRITMAHEPVDVVRWEHIECDVSSAYEEDGLYRCIEAALTSAFDRADGRLLATRITLWGATALHGQLLGDPDELLNEIRARGLDLSAGRIWIEKVALQTQPALDLELLRRRQDTLGDVVRALDLLAATPAVRAGIQADLDPLFTRLTPDVYERAPELADLRDGESLDDLLARASHLVNRCSSHRRWCAMRFQSFVLARYGHFTDFPLSFADRPDFHIIVGPNETGEVDDPAWAAGCSLRHRLLGPPSTLSMTTQTCGWWRRSKNRKRYFAEVPA